jgi:DNA helicase HerA-like ATPase
VVRLIRSKGVGVYFVTQNPLDVPESVLGQLGNRVQHALRACTPKDQRAVKTAAETLRPNPKLKAEQVITELGVGEALVSFLDQKGTPQIVERAFVVPPGSFLGPLTEAERQAAIQGSAFNQKYKTAVDRESAYEKLKVRAEEKPDNVTPLPERKPVLKPVPDSPAPEKKQPAPRASTRQTPMEAAAKGAARAIGSELGRQVIRGLLGSILGTTRRRR